METSKPADQQLSPYSDPQLNTFYNLLFCDNIELYNSVENRHSGFQWSILLSDNPNVSDLIKISQDESLETRCRILAYNKLIRSGNSDKNKLLLGVIVEVGLDEGLDVLASYKDGSARYINYTGKVIIWDTTDQQSVKLSDDLFSKCENIVRHIGPWDKARPTFPGKGFVRISFLVSDGYYFGQGPMNLFFADSLAGPTLNTAAELMGYLTEKALSSNNV